MQEFLFVLAFLACGMSVFAILKKPSSIYKHKPDEQNPFEGNIYKIIFYTFEKLKGYIDT